MATTRTGVVAVLVGLACASAGFGQAGTLVPETTGGLRRLPPPPGEPTQPATANTQTPPSATDVLTGQAPAAPPAPGSYDGPWTGDTHPGSCCGPVGGNGPIGYELISYTGPNLPTAGGILSRRLKTGWTIGGTASTLFFNEVSDAAWNLGLGVSFTYNRGQMDKPLDVYTLAPPIRDNNGTILGFQPDQLNEFVIRGMFRTNFNFSIGRDWWFEGPGAVGLASGDNWRIGTDIGGRWGTAHVDLVPTADPSNYFKKGSTTFGIFSGFHVMREIPFGATILYGGFRFEYGYDWTNVIPPQGGDIFNVNFYINAGVRF
jgi:hypothetical protein